MAQLTRVEHDLLGDREVPADAYYGVHTLRALENFPITGTPISIYPDLVARAGLRQAGRRDGEPRARPARRGASARPSSRACEEIRGRRAARPVRGGRDPGRRRHLDQHERQRGDRQPRRSSSSGTAQGRIPHLHPLDARQHVARAPTTSTRPRVKLALSSRIERLLDDMALPARGVRGEGGGVRRRAQDRPHPAAGRGADDARAGVLRLRGDAGRGRGSACEEAALLTREINLGATAIGTGINAHPDYAALVCRKLCRDHRHAARHRAQPGRGDAGRAAPSCSSPACSSASR